MASRGLLTVSLQGRKIEIGLTEEGRTLADDLSAQAIFADLAARGTIVMKAVGDMSGTRLKDFVYEVVPEITGMKWGQEIAADVGTSVDGDPV
ncbi:hypothetical protein [Brevundimonas sp.]|uniref:hypothetical protein n=1 Tax=Brevundimonas sp. TaxID=1871086 RepID=UPI002FC805AA